MIALVIAASLVPLAAPIERAGFRPSSVVAHAEVRVRIIDGATITLGQSPRQPEARLRSTNLRIDGEQRAARLVEFP